MKVKMLRSPSVSIGCNLIEGQIGTVDGDIGRLLVDANIAVEIEDPKEVKAIPEKPAIAEAQPAPIKMSKAPTTEVEAKPRPVSEAGPTTSKPTSSGRTFRPKKES